MGRSDTMRGTIVLRRPVGGDFKVLAGIRRDDDLQAMLMAVPDQTDDGAVQDWIDRRLRDSDGAFRVVANIEDDTAIGFMQVSQVHRRNRHGYGGLALTQSARGFGLGHATVALLIQLASESLGLTKLLLEVREDNVVALKVYQAAGFRIVGTLQDHFCDRANRTHNVLLLERRLAAFQA